jgi:hypothetical protein
MAYYCHHGDDCCDTRCPVHGPTIEAMSPNITDRPDVQPGEGGPFRPAGPHHTREHDVSKGRSRKPKHKKGAR